MDHLGEDRTSALMIMDEGQIFAEVERRRQRARDLGLVDLVFNLYFRGIRHYPAWSKNTPDAVHPDFRSATALSHQTLNKAKRSGGVFFDPSKQRSEGVELTVDESKCVFTFDSHTTMMPDGEDCEFGTLSLNVDGREVFEIDCHGDYDEIVGLKWTPYQVGGFIEGSWIGPLTTASKKILDWQESYREQSEQRRNREKAVELKKKFGL